MRSVVNKVLKKKKTKGRLKSLHPEKDNQGTLESKLTIKQKLLKKNKKNAKNAGDTMPLEKTKKKLTK